MATAHSLYSVRPIIMNKRDLIQRVLIRTCPPEDKIDAGIAYAETLWEKLCARGYGDAKSTGKRQTIDHYALLTPFQKKYFDRFWVSFGKVGSRNDAAKAWKARDPSAETSERIIAAALKESSRE